MAGQDFSLFSLVPHNTAADKVVRYSDNWSLFGDPDFSTKACLTVKTSHSTRKPGYGRFLTIGNNRTEADIFLPSDDPIRFKRSVTCHTPQFLGGDSVSQFLVGFNARFA